MKSLILFIVLLVSGFTFSTSALANDNHADFIASCKETIYQYALTRDRFDAEAYAHTFTEDGEFTLRGNVYKGRKVIEDRINSERGMTFDRHVVSTLEIVPVDDRNATGTVYTTVYQANGDDAKELPVTKFNMLMVVYSDTYRMTDEGCKIASRSASLDFMQSVSH